MALCNLKSLDFELGVSLLMSYGIVEVAQQSKARKKDDFLIAFSPVIAEATATAYKGATNEVQSKLKRVVEVWRQRQIFEIPIQDAIEARIEGKIPSPYLLAIILIVQNLKSLEPPGSALGEALYSPQILLLPVSRMNSPT